MNHLKTIKERGVEMKEGKLIYRDRSTVPWLYGIVVFLVLFWGVVLFVPSMDRSFETFRWLIFMTIVVGLVFRFGLKKAKSNAGFYECGIGYFENNQLIRFESYERFSTVECYFRRDDSSFKAKPKYGLIFHHSDGSMVEMNHDSVESLKRVWKQLIFQNPTLIRRLKCYLPSETESYIRFGCLEVNPVSQILFEALKKESY